MSMKREEELTVSVKPEAEPFGYWVEHKLAEPVFLRKPAYIPEGTNYTVTPLYAHPPKPEAEESEIIEALQANEPFVFDPATNFMHADDGGAPEHGIRYIPKPEAEGVDRQVHHSKPVVSQNTQTVEDNATEGGAHGKETVRLKNIENAAAYYVASVSGGPLSDTDEAWKAYDYRKQEAFDHLRAALTAKQTDGREGE